MNYHPNIQVLLERAQDFTNAFIYATLPVILLVSSMVFFLYVKWFLRIVRNPDMRTRSLLVVGISFTFLGIIAEQVARAFLRASLHKTINQPGINPTGTLEYFHFSIALSVVQLLLVLGGLFHMYSYWASKYSPRRALCYTFYTCLFSCIMWATTFYYMF